MGVCVDDRIFSNQAFLTYQRFEMHTEDGQITVIRPIPEGWKVIANEDIPKRLRDRELRLDNEVYAEIVRACVDVLSGRAQRPAV